MFWYYVINTILVVLGFIMFGSGGVIAVSSLGSHKQKRDWVGLIIGLSLMLVGVFVWWLTGSVYPEGFSFPLVGEYL